LGYFLLNKDQSKLYMRVMEVGLAMLFTLAIFGGLSLLESFAQEGENTIEEPAQETIEEPAQGPSAHQSIALATLEKVPEPFSSKTFAMYKVTPGATPRCDALFEAIVAVT